MLTFAVNSFVFLRKLKTELCDVELCDDVELSAWGSQCAEIVLLMERRKERRDDMNHDRCKLILFTFLYSPQYM